MTLNRAIRIGALASLLAACGGGGVEGGSGSSGKDGTCSDVVACGGDLEGSWKISSNCAIGDLARLMNMNLVGEDPPAGCRSLYQNFTMDMVGSMTFAEGTMTRTTEVTWKGTLHYLPDCLSERLGEKVETANASVCRRLEGQMLASEATKSASCAAVSGNCDCDFVGVEPETSEEDYRIEGNQIVSPAGQEDRMDYCVSETSLKIKETTQDLPDFAMITSLDRK
jgi:hypothetical protein